jgi:hypothetical protein
MAHSQAARCANYCGEEVGAPGKRVRVEELKEGKINSKQCAIHQKATENRRFFLFFDRKINKNGFI